MLYFGNHLYHMHSVYSILTIEARCYICLIYCADKPKIASKVRTSTVYVLFQLKRVEENNEMIKY